MRILVDTNIVLTYLSGRDDPYSNQCEKIMRMIAENRLQGVIAFHSLSTIWYVTRKNTEKQRREYIREICRLLTISGANNERVRAAVENEDFKDFEDALQDCCALETNCDYIVTANISDYIGKSKTKAVTPDELLRIIRMIKT